MNCILLPSEAFDESNSTAVIDNFAQVKHIKQVLKLEIGDVLKIGQLGGRLGVARLDTFNQNTLKLCDVSLDRLPPAKMGITVVLALPRPKVLRRLVMDMTAIGVDKIVLMNSYRSDKAYWQSPLLDRIDEFVLEGLQQGMDSIAPDIILEKRFKPFVEDRLADLGENILLAHPYAKDDINTANRPDVLVVGAEGGFIDYEIELMCAQGVKTINLGERILRTEAAVNVLLGRYL